MKWFAISTMALLAGALAGCDQLSQLGPKQADSAPPPVEAGPAAPDLRPLIGADYATLIAAQPQFSAASLGFNEAEQGRFAAAMATPAAPAWIVSGGGAEAIVFTGCAQAGCGAGKAVVAIDLATGGVFAGVRDSAGADQLAPNARVEALLRLNAPNRTWDGAAPASAAAAP
jgi:hypothetical protein